MAGRSNIVKDATQPIPRLVIDLAVVRRQFETLRRRLPFVRIYYAVKANATLDVLRVLAPLGCGFDVYSAKAAELAFAAGAERDNVYYDRLDAPLGDIERAFAQGVRRFSVASVRELDAISPLIPGSEILGRVRYRFAQTPVKTWQKLGAYEEELHRIARRASRRHLVFRGVNTHLGTQQLDVGVWEFAISNISRVLKPLRGMVDRPIINLGGSFPIRYQTRVPTIDTIEAAIKGAVWRHFGDIGREGFPRFEVEPGRFLVGPAGVIMAGVESVRRGRPDQIRLDDQVSQAVFYQMLDYGIRYPIRLERNSSAPMAAYVLEGLNHRGKMTALENVPYRLPSDIRPGDILRIGGTGAYCNFDLETQNERRYMTTVFKGS